VKALTKTEVRKEIARRRGLVQVAQADTERAVKAAERRAFERAAMAVCIYCQIGIAYDGTRGRHLQSGDPYCMAEKIRRLAGGL
jgi:hypothetical protein